MVIIMTVKLSEFIKKFSEDYCVQSLDDNLCGSIVAHVSGDNYLIRLGDVNYAGND